MQFQPMHGQVLLLATAQALFVTASAMVMTIGGIAGGQIAPAPELATAPVAASFLGTALVTVPASLWMTRVGRRPGFVVGALFGIAGGILAAIQGSDRSEHACDAGAQRQRLQHLSTCCVRRT